MSTPDVVWKASAGHDAHELDRWIADGWVRPQRLGDSGAVLQSIDIARIQLVRELHALDINDDAMPVVLCLLDQIYALRRRMRAVRGALLALSPEMRQSVLSKIAAERERDRQRQEA